MVHSATRDNSLEMLLTDDTVQKKSKREAKRKSKPDPFYHEKLLAERRTCDCEWHVEHKQEMEEKKKERERKEMEIKSNLKHRKQVAKQMQKRTHKGQPLMKDQIPNLLQKIESKVKSEWCVC